MQSPLFFPLFYIFFITDLCGQQLGKIPTIIGQQLQGVCSVRGTTLWPMRLFKCSGVNLPGPRGMGAMNQLIHRSSPIRLAKGDWPVLADD